MNKEGVAVGRSSSRLVVLRVFGYEPIRLGQGIIPLLLANSIVDSLQRGFDAAHSVKEYTLHEMCLGLVSCLDDVTGYRGCSK